MHIEGFRRPIKSDSNGVKSWTTTKNQKQNQDTLKKDGLIRLTYSKKKKQMIDIQRIDI